MTYMIAHNNIIYYIPTYYTIYRLIWVGSHHATKGCLAAACIIFITVRNMFSHSNFTNILSSPLYNSANLYTHTRAHTHDSLYT